MINTQERLSKVNVHIHRMNYSIMFYYSAAYLFFTLDKHCYFNVFDSMICKFVSESCNQHSNGSQLTEGGKGTAETGTNQTVLFSLFFLYCQFVARQMEPVNLSTNY